MYYDTPRYRSEDLTIEEGTRVHFHKDSGNVLKKYHIIINGRLSEIRIRWKMKLFFEGSRLEPFLFPDTPGHGGRYLDI